MKGVQCPKCKGIPKAVYPSGDAFNTNICYERCGYIYWTLAICPYCEQPEKTVILKKPNFGQKISCKNCQSSMYYFRCPQNDCGQLFFKTEASYTMGAPNWCEKCDFKYKTLACPCGGEVIIDKNTTIFEGYSINRCDCCNKNLIYTICPTCRMPEYHLDQLQIGQRIKCSHCKTFRKYVPCPKCGHSLKGNTFSYYEPVHCNHCKIDFQYCKCPYGCPTVSFTLITKELGPKKFCYDCKKDYFVVNCKKCENTLYQQTMNIGEAIVDSCPHCKSNIQYYLCPCGLFNRDKPQCIDQRCAKPKNVTNNIKKKQEEMPNKLKKENNSEDTQCKLCFDAKSEFINEVCGHILMCQNCVRSYLKGNNNNAQPCPVCKTIGRYYKYKDPIYS